MEGAAEAIATFRNAAVLLREHRRFIFNHNEAVLYRWVERYDPALFKEIRALVRAGRWVIAGGWHLQPDVNLPGLESLIRQIVEGRRYFWEKFRARPRVAYNFDSFGHGGGLPQILKLAGSKMYIHMRPQKEELSLPSDLYIWRGVDGSEILTLRIEPGLYHSERDNIEEKIKTGVELALRLGRDTAVFWGLGNHGGGATREALAEVDTSIAREKRVEIIHSTPDRLYEALKCAGRKAPVVEGDLQRVFTGCYTSMARVKRKAEESLGAVVQAETLSAAAWWLAGREYPNGEMAEAWRDHLFNDFHDILSGSCSEPAEKDALDLYGKVLETTRRLSLGAAAALNRMLPVSGTTPVPVTVLNSNPALTEVPVEVECMADYRPFWKGEWHLRVYRRDGTEIVFQEEQPESLLPFNWRKKLCFLAELPGVGAAPFEVKAFPEKRTRPAVPRPNSELIYKINRNTGLIGTLLSPQNTQVLRGPLLQPLVIRDEGDSWGTGRWAYRDVIGRFRLEPGSLKVIEKGPVRTITESVMAYKKSRIVFQTISYPDWPALEFRLRVLWNDERATLKLAVPTVFRQGRLLCEVPGGAIERPADGEEHVFGRWAIVEGDAGDGRGEKALAVIGCGPHGLDFKDGELRISVLRSAAYCHERGFKLAKYPARKFMDQGVHEMRFLVTSGEAEKIRGSLTALADWLSAPPLALAHLPFGEMNSGELKLGADGDREMEKRSGEIQREPQEPSAEPITSPLALSPENIRLTACKPSRDGKALVVRLHETSGREISAELTIFQPLRVINLEFKPFEIKTVRVERSGAWREVDLIEEV
jgi:alpha-mannosidase